MSIADLTTRCDSIATNEISRRDFRVAQVAPTSTLFNNLPTPPMARFVTVAAFIGYIKYKFHHMNYRCSYKDLPSKVSRLAKESTKGQLIYSVIQQIADPPAESFDLDNAYVMHQGVQRYLLSINQQHSDNTSESATPAISHKIIRLSQNIKKSIKKKSSAVVAAKIAAAAELSTDAFANIMTATEKKSVNSSGQNEYTEAASAKDKLLLQKQYRQRQQPPLPLSLLSQSPSPPIATDVAVRNDAEGRGEIKYINNDFIKTFVGKNYNMVLQCESNCGDCARLRSYRCEWRCVKCIYISLINIVAVFYDLFGIQSMDDIIYEFRNTLDGVYLLRSHAANTVYLWLSSKDFYYQLVPNALAYDSNIRVQQIPLSLTCLLQSFIRMFDTIFERQELAVRVGYDKIKSTRAQIEQSISSIFYTMLGEITLYIKHLGYLSKTADVSAHNKSLNAMGAAINSPLSPYPSIADSQSEQIKIIDITQIVLKCCSQRIAAIVSHYHQPKMPNYANAEWKNVLHCKLVAIISNFFVSIVDIFDSNANHTNQMLALYDNGTSAMQENYKVVVNIYSILAGLNSVAEHCDNALESRKLAEEVMRQNSNYIDKLLGVDYSLFRVNSIGVAEIQLFVNAITAPSAADCGMTAEHRFKLARNFSEVIQKQKMWYLKSVHVQTLANINICLKSYLSNTPRNTSNAVSIIISAE